MSLNLGSTSIDSLYLGSTKIGEAYLGSTKVYGAAPPVDPYNPLGLPPFTIRCKFSSGTTPTMGDSQTLVDATNNVWDITKNSTDWQFWTDGDQTLLEVLGANTSSVTSMEGMFFLSPSLTSVSLFDTSSVTNMGNMFYDCMSLTSVPLFDTSSVTNMYSVFGACESLTSVPLFDTSSVTDMEYAFEDCYALTAIPLFDTSSVTNMDGAFKNCIHVEHGSLALYQQASSQATPPASHSQCFRNCGSETTTGSAELAQIPDDWK